MNRAFILRTKGWQSGSFPGFPSWKGTSMEDGLFDLIKCNFHSAPDTGFNLKELLPCLYYLRDRKRDEYEEQIYDRMYAIAGHAADGLLCGGFHTPNHRLGDRLQSGGERGFLWKGRIRERSGKLPGGGQRSARL